MPPVSSQQGQSDNSMGPIWIVIGVFAVIIILWYFLRVPVLKAYLSLKLIEVDAISLFTSSLNSVRATILAADPATVSLDTIVQIANAIGLYFAVLTGVCLLIFSYFLYKKSTNLRFRRTYNMKTLLRAENINWPQTTPVVELDLIKEDIEQGPWAMAKTPMQFAKMNKLLKEQKKAAEEGMLSREARIDVVVNRARATEVFVKQLGKPWQGIDALNMHTKALFAVFAARANGDVEVGRKLLSQIAASSRNKRIDFTGVSELLNKHRHSPIVLEVIDRHAFILPMMATMLELARTVGVQASADFLWLKPIDRRLWFMMNAVGRQTPPAEVAGAFAHWLVEKRLGRKVVTPMIDEAIKALEDAIASVIYKPGEE